MKNNTQIFKARVFLHTTFAVFDKTSHELTSEDMITVSVSLLSRVIKGNWSRYFESSRNRRTVSLVPNDNQNITTCKTSMFYHLSGNLAFLFVRFLHGVFLIPLSSCYFVPQFHSVFYSYSRKNIVKSGQWFQLNTRLQFDCFVYILFRHSSARFNSVQLISKILLCL